MINVQSALTKSCTFAVTSFLLYKGRLERSSLSTDVCPSLKGGPIPELA
jgi:hypothetical protein